MITDLKPIESLTVADLAANPIWEYTNRDGSSETFVRAIKKTPVQTLTGPAPLWWTGSHHKADPSLCCWMMLLS
jgi:hypothetical protein